MKTGNRHAATGNRRGTKVIGFALCAMLFALCVSVEAQQPKKTPRIGFLSTAAPPGTPYESFRHGLRDLGYVEGQNITIEYRSGEGIPRLTELATELVQLKVDLIVAQGQAAFTAETTVRAIPVVFGLSGDPVDAGLIDSLARPGGNMTGMTFLAFELVGKRLELLKEAVPKISRVAVLAYPGHPGEQRELKETQLTAQALKIALHYLSVTNPTDIDKAFGVIANEHTDAILAFPDPITMAHRTQIAEFAVKRRLPSVFGWKDYVEAGGLMSYGPNLDESWRRVAVYVEKILKGTKPADLPVERPAKFEFIINLKTAIALGLTIPQSVLFRADKVLK
jgi:putative tryptophan/tyrosine transport system substrate-binding protein